MQFLEGNIQKNKRFYLDSSPAELIVFYH